MQQHNGSRVTLNAGGVSGRSGPGGLSRRSKLPYARRPFSGGVHSRPLRPLTTRRSSGPRAIDAPQIFQLQCLGRSKLNGLSEINHAPPR